MKTCKPVARAAIIADEDWNQALYQALESVRGTYPDVVLLFASGEYAAHYQDMLHILRHELAAPLLIGCSAQGTIGTGIELENAPALSLLTLSLPEATLYPVRIPVDLLEQGNSPVSMREALNVPLDDVNAWLFFLDPFHMDCESLVEHLSGAYPDIPMLGGLASNDIEEHRSYIFFNDEVFTDGGVALALGGAYSILPLVSQGCEPIGEPWTITRVQDNGLVETISNRPAYEMLIETFQGLPYTLQRRAQHNLLVGLAADEYRATFERGTFLIRNLLGVDRSTGALALGAQPRVGQTIQFQMRDAQAADHDLRTRLSHLKDKLVGNMPIAAILCTCNGRGEDLFSVPHHDAGLIEQILGPIPLAGLFCNGEIGPVGRRSFLHGFTASIAVLVHRR
uniref:Histidine kinase n=1 Tax=Thermosporothrix sp. COM3 TaxID=2490863 RepID=A0A455SRC6_9CHLR|nr:hypothetical protein KTC_47190 [Thermosporothrix sp. COM3]